MLVTDAFPPLRTSGAVQMRDLAIELQQLHHDITVVTPDPSIAASHVEESYSGVTVIRLRTLQAKDVGHKRRAIMELLMPYLMSMIWNRHFADRNFDGVAWYSPSIFFGPFIKMIKHRSKCPAYLIIRDIFPDWAVDMGIIQPGLSLRLLRHIANEQYRQADVIGVQAAGNLAYFSDWQQRYPDRRVEVLENWLAPSGNGDCSIDISRTKLHGRTIFVYAGNMGLAQGMGTIGDMVHQLRHRSDLGFVFVGRGSEAETLRTFFEKNDCNNVLFYNEISPEEIPALYKQCSIGIVALDTKHKSHNIPGKFISYIQAGLPVLASINPGNDLENIINERGVGKCSSSGDANKLADLAVRLVSAVAENKESLSARCSQLFNERFASQAAAAQLVAALQRNGDQ